MKKKLIILTAGVLLLCSPGQLSAAQNFSDVSDADWFAPYVREARELDILAGYPDGSFRPQNNVTYGEFLAMALRGQGEKTESGSHWAAGYFRAALNRGIVGEGDFSLRALSNPIPRRDMALILAGLLKESEDPESAPLASLSFSDVKSTDEREYAIALCNQKGVLTGYPDGTFRPYGFLKRSEAAAAMTALAAELNWAEGDSGNVKAGETAGDAADGAGAVALADIRSGRSEGKDAPAPSAPADRAALLATETLYIKTGDPNVRDYVDQEALRYIEAVLAGISYDASSGAVRIPRPAAPAAGGVRLAAELANASGSGLDGRVWNCRSGMENLPSYDASLKEAGETVYTFSADAAGAARYFSVRVTVMGENGETSFGLYEADLQENTAEIQYKASGENFSVSGTAAASMDAVKGR